MNNRIIKATSLLVLVFGIMNSSIAQKTKTKNKSVMTTEQVKKESSGHWQSITTEVRPSNSKNPDGTLKPFYLKRDFVLAADSTFELAVTSFADPYGKVALAKIYIKGQMEWKGDHPIAEGAQKVDYTASIEYTVTPLHQGFVDILNSITKGFNQWKAGETQSILKKAFPPFGLTDGQIFKEYDLIYLYDGMMFWGARNIDGRGFDTEQNRPTNLQVPMTRVQ